MSILVALHALAAVVWVGGMVFAHFMLRPSLGPLEPAHRLALWGRVFARFFPTVWVALALLLGTGYAMIFAHWGGFAALPLYLHLMQGIGLVMALLFAHLWFAPYARFKAALASGEGPAAAVQLNRIRLIVTINMTLGLINAVVGPAGRYLG